MWDSFCLFQSAVQILFYSFERSTTSGSALKLSALNLRYIWAGNHCRFVEMVWVGVESVSWWLLEGQLLPNSVEAVCVKASMYPWIHNKPSAHLLQRLYELHDKNTAHKPFRHSALFYMKNKRNKVTWSQVYSSGKSSNQKFSTSSLHICSPQIRVRTLPG